MIKILSIIFNKNKFTCLKIVLNVLSNLLLFLKNVKSIKKLKKLYHFNGLTEKFVYTIKYKKIKR